MTKIMTILHGVRTRISVYIKHQCIYPLNVVNHKNMIFKDQSLLVRCRVYVVGIFEVYVPRLIVSDQSSHIKMVK